MTPQRPTNTSAIDPAEHLLSALVLGATGSIEAQEAAGQREIVNSTSIPTDCPADELEALGFTLGHVHEDDPLFRDAVLPEGWTREGSDHAMWSYIVDAEGFCRVAIFYKAAFYDRRAFASVERVPQTAAQRAVVNDMAERNDPDSASWMHHDERRLGPRVVYEFRGRYGDAPAPQGMHSYSDDGRRLEVVVAPDGTELARREFRVDPSPKER